MSGWNRTRRLTLREPWEEYWVEVRSEVEMGRWLDFQDAWAEAQHDPREATIEAALDFVRWLIPRHNIATREGLPNAGLSLRELTPDLTRALVEAISAAQEGAGEAVDPFGSPGSSPAPSSRAPRSRTASRSSASRKGA